jgi:signal transduction histidine kinase
VTGLDEIETLIGRAGVPVALDRAGKPRRVPAAVDRGAYRVVRDALAGAGNATEASVAIEYMPGAVAVQVDHDGAGAALPEMVELAAALGGGLKAARHPGGGFRVRAWLPTEGQPPSPAGPRAAR